LLHLVIEVNKNKILMSGVVKIDTVEMEETLKALLLKTQKVEEKEKVKVLYWLKTKIVDSV
jgi:hypothetical protein